MADRARRQNPNEQSEYEGGAAVAAQLPNHSQVTGEGARYGTWAKSRETIVAASQKSPFGRPAPMTIWNPMVLLANVKLIDAIEAHHAAFAPTKDARVHDLITEHPLFAKFLECFMNEFNEKRCTTVLLLHSPAPDTFSSSDAMASIRDILAASVVLRARARHMQQGPRPGIRYSSAFDFYPWMVSKDYEHVTSITPELHGLHVVDNFRGQTSPGIPDYVLSYGSIDKPLFDALLDRWVDAYANESPCWEDAKLMRSLNMAYHACQSPGGPETSIFDFGRTIALWVSALEILAHPGNRGKVNQHKVEKILKRSQWIDPCSEAFSLDICGRLYKQRHDFLHGNPIEINPLAQAETLSLFRIAAPLYRLALSAFLNLKCEALDASLEDTEILAKQLASQMEFEDYQKEHEAAIRVAQSKLVGA